MLLRYMLAVSLLAVNSIAWADSIDVNLSNDVAQFQYLASSGRVGQGVSEFHMGFLYNNSSNAMVDVGLTVSNSDDRSSIATFGIGVKAIAATVGKNTNAVALALGG